MWWGRNFVVLLSLVLAFSDSDAQQQQRCNDDRNRYPYGNNQPMYPPIYPPYLPLYSQYYQQYYPGALGVGLPNDDASTRSGRVARSLGLKEKLTELKDKGKKEETVETHEKQTVPEVEPRKEEGTDTNLFIINYMEMEPAKETVTITEEKDCPEPPQHYVKPQEQCNSYGSWGQGGSNRRRGYYK